MKLGNNCTRRCKRFNNIYNNVSWQNSSPCSQCFNHHHRVQKRNSRRGTDSRIVISHHVSNSNYRSSRHNRTVHDLIRAPRHRRNVSLHRETALCATTVAFPGMSSVSAQS